MAPTLDRVIDLVAAQTGVRLERLSGRSAIAQDVRISGDDVTELVEALAAEFGDHVRDWPWARFAGLDEGLSGLAPLRLVWQVLTWPARGRLFDPSPYERLELAHVAKAIDAGHWLEP